jgi:cytochrome c oxidase subunit 4
METEMEPATAVSARERPHPGPRDYVKIAAALAIVTLIEVAVYYVDFLRPALVPLLLIFSAIKFALVVLWFMHLRFDSRLFMRLFVAGVVLALSLFAVAFGLFFGG